MGERLILETKVGENKEDACRGDSGGPLITEPEDGSRINIVVGILSGGGVDCLKLGEETTTTATTEKGKWMKISSFKPWIDETIKKELEPVDGQWGRWSPWGSCSAACVETRHRNCDSPEPQNGGKECDDEKNSRVDEEERSCSTGSCETLTTTTTTKATTTTTSATTTTTTTVGTVKIVSSWRQMLGKIMKM